MITRLLYFIGIGYACWLGMMAVHESGHALAAWITGGHVQRIVLPMWGFSRTDVSPNPHQAIEVWAGPIWGSVVPLIIWAAIRKPWKTWRFFAGFCLIANGSYLGTGWTMTAGDAADLVKLGTPTWVLACVGCFAVGIGLYIWHRLDPK